MTLHARKLVSQVDLVVVMFARMDFLGTANMAALILTNVHQGTLTHVKKILFASTQKDLTSVTVIIHN